MRAATWNVSSMVGRSGEVVDALHRRKIDFCCASKQVCGMTKGPPRHKETWWWNTDVEKVVAKRKVCHKAWRKSKSAEDKHTLNVSKKELYTAVLAVQVTRIHCCSSE